MLPPNLIMDLHQTLPPSYGNIYQSSSSNPLVPLQRSQSLQQHPPPAQYYSGPSTHPLSAQQPFQPGLGFQQQQHYVQQQHQLHAQVAPSFATHPSQPHLSRVAHHPPPHHLVQHQHHQQQHPQPIQPSQTQHQQVQHQQYTLPVHHQVLPVQQQSHPITATQVQHVDSQTYLEVNTEPEPQQFEVKPDDHLKGLKLVSDPPDLDTWRQRLFNVDDMIVVSEEE
jgi:glutathione S-transferase